MKLNDEQLRVLEEYAGAFFSIHQCAIIMGVDPYDLDKAVKDETSDAHKAYYKGYLLSQFKVRKEIIKMAERGSSPAQTLVKKLIEESDHNNYLKR
jgi:hypothetical protein